MGKREKTKIMYGTWNGAEEPFSNIKQKNILYIFVILIICHAKFSRATPLEYEDSEFSGTQYYRSDNC